MAESIVASGSGMPILMLTAADRLDDKASGFGLGADDYLTKPFELRELVLRLRALNRRRAHSRPPVREIAGLRLDPFRREVYRDGRYVALTRKQFAVLEVLGAAEGGVISAEELLERAWDENADPFTNAVRITVSALRKRLGEPWVIATVPGVGYRICASTPFFSQVIPEQQWPEGFRFAGEDCAYWSDQTGGLRASCRSLRFTGSPSRRSSNFCRMESDWSLHAKGLDTRWPGRDRRSVRLSREGYSGTHDR